MDYEDVVTAFFAPRPGGTEEPEVVVTASPARRLRDSCEPIAMHAVWNRRTNERLAALGLDFLQAYVGGRASSLGEPVGAVVASAFAWFEPGFLAAQYDAVRTAVERDLLVRARDEATTASLAEVLSGDDPTEVADLLSDAVESAEGAGRPLFCGLRSRGRPTDPVQRLWWASDLIREHRGDSHVAAAATSLLGPVEMNILTELWIGMPLFSYTATRGWPPEVMQAAVVGFEARGWLRDGALTESGVAARRAVEVGTDAQEQSIVEALGDRFEEVCVSLGGWSARCIEAGAFPADILKRAAG